MKKQGKGKRKVKDYKESIKNITTDENYFEQSNKKNQKKIINNYSINNYTNKNNKKNKVKEKMQKELMLEAAKASDFISNIMKGQSVENLEKKSDILKEEKKEKNDSDSSSEHSISEEKKVDDTNNKNKNIKTDKIFLSSLYELFDEYDEIIIKRDKNQQYIINACLKIDEDKEIKFEIIYDKEREYFDYYPDNKNFEFEKDDEPFNYDLDIAKEDFCLLIRNFKKYKKK